MCCSWSLTTPATRLAKVEAGLWPSDLLLAEVVPLLAGLLSVPCRRSALRR